MVFIRYLIVVLLSSFYFSYSDMVCFKDLNGSGNFELGTDEVSSCILGANGTSYLCPTGKEKCVLKGQCPGFCCWSGSTPVFNPSTLKCETDPGYQYTYPGAYFTDPYSRYTEDFSGYDVSRKCFVDSNNNCLSDTATVSVSAKAGDYLRPWGEISRMNTVNTRAGIVAYVNGQKLDEKVISADPYTWGGYTITYTAPVPDMYTFKVEYYGYTPEPDTKISVRTRLRWQNKDGQWTTIGYYNTGYDNTNETNKKVLDYTLYLDANEKFEMRLERHPAMFQGQVSASIKMAVALEYPDGTISYLGIKSCNVDWLSGWWGSCGGWGEILAGADGTYTMHMKVYASSSNPSAWGDNAYLMLIKKYPSCPGQYPFNSTTGKCEGIPTKVDWTCPSGSNYECVPVNEGGTTVNYCNTASCTDKYTQGCY